MKDALKRENLADIIAYDRAVAEGGEPLPAEAVRRMVDGDPQKANRCEEVRKQARLRSPGGFQGSKREHLMP